MISIIGRCILIPPLTATKVSPQLRNSPTASGRHFSCLEAQIKVALRIPNDFESTSYSFGIRLEPIKSKNDQSMSVHPAAATYLRSLQQPHTAIYV